MTQPAAPGIQGGGNSPVMTSLHAGRTVTAHAAFLLSHLRPGMTLLDCGCGLGNITIGLAQAVAPGEVVGIDVDADRISQAAASAQEQGVTNVEFRVGDVHQLEFPDAAFDAAFEHACFEHLAYPLVAAREVHRVLKPGGIFGARDTDHDGWIFGGAEEEVARTELDACLEFIDRWTASRGTNYCFGKHLPSVLRRAGFAEVVVSASCDVATQGPLLTISQQVLTDTRAMAYARTQGIDVEVVFPGWLEALERWIRHPDAFVVLTQIEAVGWKR